MIHELEKTYDPSIEERIYNNWLDKKYFHAEVDKSKKPFTIVMPPPNITGKLHMGHALDNTLQDILIRWKRMSGYNALWVPGTDHASISTEVKIVQKMAEEGITKNDITREQFLERAWAWKEEYGSEILKQLRKLGSSCDWDRVRFTMDEGCSKAVLETFIRLYNKGYIYRGEKLINWCPKCQTTISDAEVNHVDMAGHFWHIKYPIAGTDEFLELATTRPETMLGDTAVAVHPDDDRYKNLIGKTAILPIVNKEIPIIADSYVDMEFGTGVVKITPAHDPNDYEVGERHNLPKINVFNDDGTINANGGKYEGMDRYEARKLIVKELEDLGLLVRVEDITHSVGVHERCNEVVEPMIKLQWFVKMDELAKPAIDVYKKGELRFIPERFGKTYMHWLDNIRDWCISRQLWWGHRIPAYYCEDCGHMAVAKHAPHTCKKCGGTRFKQDEDVLDTWFSSALWPFSTLGWPDKTPELEYFFPTNVLVTGYDIIFFWVARMIFSSINEMGRVPFKDVLIHGIVRDDQGRKMSKSLGNGIDPLEVIDKYGADALRFSLAMGNSPGNDMRFYWEKAEAYRNFANKIWNAARFVMMNINNREIPGIEGLELDIADKWILARFNKLTGEITANMEKYELGLSAQKLYDFIWSEYCDWYIELTKPRLYGDKEEAKLTALAVLCHVLSGAMKLLHPFMPFITEEIYLHLPNAEETIMRSAWPTVREEMDFRTQEEQFEGVIELIRNIRNLRAEMDVPAGKRTAVYILPGRDSDFMQQALIYFEKLAGASKAEIISERPAADEKMAAVVGAKAECFIPMGELIDAEKELSRLQKEKENLLNEIKRAEGKLNNPGFVNKAPAQVVDSERAKAEKYRDMLEKVEQRIKAAGELI